MEKRLFRATIYVSICGIWMYPINRLVCIALSLLLSPIGVATNSRIDAPDFVDIVDIKPANMEELTEVITAAEFHPVNCNLFMYSISKGAVRLADMRDNALCEKNAKGTHGPSGYFVIVDWFVDHPPMGFCAL
jgi:hypothetical protein